MHYLIQCHQPKIDKNYLYIKDPLEAKYQLLINKRESTDLKYCKDFKAFVDHLNDMNDIYNNMNEYNPNRKIVLDRMIAMLSNEKRNPIVTELFIKSYKIKHFSFLLSNLILLYQKIFE